MQDVVRAVASLETAEVVVSPNRPVADNDGVDITPWHAHANAAALTAVACFMVGDGANRTLSSPTGGTKGPELHAQVLRKSGAKLWACVGSLDADLTIEVPGAGAAAREANYVAWAQRLAIAATPSAGAPTYFLQPLAVGTEEG